MALPMELITTCRLGTPETNLSGLKTRKVRKVFKLMLPSKSAGSIMGRNLEKWDCTFIID